MNATVVIEEIRRVGENRSGYAFGIGRVGGRWVGFAAALVGGRAKPFLAVFPQVCEGHELGMTDPDAATRLVAALAQDPEGGFGGVDVWYVPPELRCPPDALRCPACGAVGCKGGCGERDV